MECLEFRRLVGADPRHPDSAALAHAAECVRCEEYRRQMLLFDLRILAALTVPLPPAGARRATGASIPAVLDRRRWMALAASIVAGVLVGSLLWVSGPRNSVAQDLLAHLDHEPQALVVTNTPADSRKLDRVLERGGIRLLADVGTVSFANSCRFRGRTVPHLVVQSDRGPVTVIVLRDERTDAPVSFAERGFSGTIVPAGPGSIAVIGAAETDVHEITERVVAAVDWNRE